MLNRLAVGLTLLAVAASAGGPTAVGIATDKPIAQTSRRLTSVTIDICALKQGLDFSNSLFVTLAKHLAPTVLRIGGTDQNHFSYDMSSKQPMEHCQCGKPCVMTAAYWSTVQTFFKETGLELIFGLSPESASNAASLVYHTAHQNFTNVFAYSFGNEQTGNESLAEAYLEKMQDLRKALFKAYPIEAGIPRPLLIGADTGIGPRHSGYTPTNASSDVSIQEHFAWVKTFVKKCAPVLDAVSWHTYDYRAQELGIADHHPLPFPPNDSVTKFFDPSYHDFAGTLADNMTKIVQSVSPKLAQNIWLTETNSICHQGTFNITNAFFNSLWLLDRFGIMAGRGVQLMGRQSLIGYNYSLLGNFPAEPIFAAPDYYLTILFQRLAADAVLGVENTPSPTLRMYAFCSAQYRGGVTVALINLHEHQIYSVSLSLPGRQERYLLSPAWSGDDGATARTKATSRHMQLNGRLLAIASDGELPDLSPERHSSGAVQTIPPLQLAFAVFPDAQAEACLQNSGFGESRYV